MNEYTIEEISKHNSLKSLWIIIDDHVFDVTNYKSHPGGMEIFLKHATTDCTEIFDEIGHVDAYDLMDNFCIGKVKH